ncbi:hypothetical protein OG935_06215 [Nocardia cyriacigeorgica]|uniref:hypothetical protein n=1 Tax=Nocardia cyriacigeorgica TaxID=135487 RepID=UPI0018940245|nr:hypothetical protein [Nocardia cyriacigeorgica]MBF6496529.1 hypothetical protein [Nocardia cyriacigeorgica]
MNDPARPPRPPVSDRIPVPMRLAAAPTAQGMVVPVITLAHRDRTRPVWGKLDLDRQQHALRHRLCQICGEPLTDPVVLYIRPADYLRGVAAEPGMHPECAQYSRRACPMLAGTQHRYNPSTNNTRRCSDPECRCRYWAPHEPDPATSARTASAAEAWYETWIRLGDYHLTTAPADFAGRELIGITLHYTIFRRLRKIRDAAPGTASHRPSDVLALLAATRALSSLLDGPSEN